MTYEKVTRDSFPSAVGIALQECVSLRAETKDAGLIRDLDAAICALRLIEAELHGESVRPRDQRSSAFTRYVIDEGARMVMSDDLKQFVVKIEDVYKRWVEDNPNRSRGDASKR